MDRAFRRDRFLRRDRQAGASRDAQEEKYFFHAAILARKDNGTRCPLITKP
jgi:hypothetical protein